MTLTVTGEGSAVRGAFGSKQGGTGTTMNSSDISVAMLSTSLVASVDTKLKRFKRKQCDISTVDNLCSRHKRKMLNEALQQ